MPTPAYEVVKLTQHRTDSEGRSFWAAEIVCADGTRIGATTAFGAWMAYEVTDGSPLVLAPNTRDSGLREIRFEVAAALQAEVAKLREDAGETVATQRRRR